MFGKMKLFKPRKKLKAVHLLCDWNDRLLMQMFPQNLATFGKKPEDASAVNIDPITRKKPHLYPKVEFYI